MISTENVTLGFGGRNLFEDVNIVFTPGFKYGVIGANGAGKSTFLKLLAGEIEGDKGNITRPPRARLAMLRQDHNHFDEFTILQTVYQGYPKLWKLMQERERLYAKGEDLTDEEGIRLGEVEGEFMEVDGYSAEADAAALLDGLGVPQPIHDRLMSEVPTNYKFRALLAQTLFGNPDILLLDEPTNNLDIRSIGWLENFLNEYEGTLLIVSHDRQFLNSVCTHIADIDFGKIQVYTGDYDYYQGAIAIARDQKMSDEVRRKRKAEELKKFIQRFGAHKAKARQATSRKKQLEQLLNEESVRPSSRVYPSIIFPMGRELGKDVVRLEGVSKGFEGNPVLKDMNFHFGREDKVAIIGPNGVGKTTLMRLLAGRIEPDKGEVHWGVTCKKSYCPQDVKAELPKGMTLVQYLHTIEKDLDDTFVRGLLGRMLFRGEDGDKKVDILSGGESVRLMLAKMMIQEGNVLLLDEPTNHLDLESIESLNDGLKRFPGVVFFVSHDREFIRSVATRVVELFPDHSYTDYQGTYDEYMSSGRRDAHL